MSKYLSLLRYESKTIVRDPMNLYMCLFPIVMLFLASFVFPLIFESADLLQETMLKAAMLLLLVVILAFGSFFLAAMATFLLLEQKDEHTLHTIAVTPVGAGGYLRFKMAYIYVMSVLGNTVILLGTKLLAGHRYTIWAHRSSIRLTFCTLSLLLSQRPVHCGVGAAAGGPRQKQSRGFRLYQRNRHAGFGPCLDGAGVISGRAPIRSRYLSQFLGDQGYADSAYARRAGSQSQLSRLSANRCDLQCRLVGGSLQHDPKEGAVLAGAWPLHFFAYLEGNRKVLWNNKRLACEDCLTMPSAST